MSDRDDLDRLLAQHFRATGNRAGEEASAGRVLATLLGPLPPQRRAWRLWPAELLDWSFAPAWPRVAALASCAVLGFAVGIASPIWRGHDGLLIAPAHADSGIAAILSEPEPLPEALP